MVLRGRPRQLGFEPERLDCALHLLRNRNELLSLHIRVVNLRSLIGYIECSALMLFDKVPPTLNVLSIWVAAWVSKNVYISRA